MIDLPDKWILTPLENCGEWGSGGTPRRTNPRYYNNGTIPWLIIGDLNDGLVLKSATFITEEGLKNSSAKLLPINTLLIAMYGSIGKLGITGIECATNQAIAYCKPNTDIALLKYLFYTLMNSKEALLAQGQGGAQQNINQGILKSHNIPLAPLNEQKRISEKLDSLLARVDSCQSHLERIPQILKRFRQSVLATATSGRLTEDWRNEKGVNGEWENCALGDVLTDIKYGTAKKSIYELKNGIPVLRIPNIKDGKIDSTDLKFSHFDKKEIESLSLKTGDLLLIRSNGSVDLVGKVAIVDSNFEGFMYAGYLIRMRFDTSKVNPQYISFYLSSPAIRSYIELTSRSTSGVNNINSEEVKAISLELPSIEEQAEIVRRVEKLFAYAERLEARYYSATEHVERLTPSLLAKAFRGELVSQDPNDEPISVLLERIQEAKKTAVAKPRVYVERSKRIEERMLKRNEIQTNHLSAILLEHGAMTAEALWSASQLEIDEFYDQLKDEEAKDLLHEVRGEDENSPRLLEAL